MEKIKDIWYNRKTRGIIFLIFYIILFSYIFIVYGKKSEKIILPENKPQRIEKEVFNNYEYDYYYNDKVIHVVKYNDIVEFNETENPLNYNFDYLSNLESIKKISSLVKTSKYVDGTNEENYNINLAQLLYIFGIQEEVDAKEVTNYSIITFSKKISEIVFYDLNIKIKYTNFSDVSEININYDFLESGD